MLRSFVVVLFIAPCISLESTPSESSFMPFATANSVPEIIAQEQLFRKFADITLGFQIASQFQALGSYEFQKFQKLKDGDDSDDLEEQISAPQVSKPAVLEEDDDGDDDDDDISLLELKSGQFGMYPGYGYGAYPGMGMGVGLGQPATSSLSLEELEHAGSYAKMSALKAMHLQFYMAASDVEKSYWVNRLISATMPPQMTMFKLFKSYLNTMALSTALQFHDSFTFEAYMDDFNDRYGTLTGTSSQLTEALAEHQVFSHWSSLAMIKYQLFMINMYEKMFMGNMAQQVQAAQSQAYVPAAASYLEVDAEPFVGAGQDPSSYLMYQMAFFNYYGMMLKYYSISLELSIAQAGVAVAQSKYAAIHGDDVSEQFSTYASTLESTQLPHLYMQWGSINQQKYTLEYYQLMLNFYAPGMAVAQAADRAENVFQNLVQTDAPVTTPAEQPATPAAAQN